MNSDAINQRLYSQEEELEIIISGQKTGPLIDLDGAQVPF